MYFRSNAAPHMPTLPRKHDGKYYSDLQAPSIWEITQATGCPPPPLSSAVALEASRWLGTSFDVDLWLLLTDLRSEWAEEQWGHVWESRGWKAGCLELMMWTDSCLSSYTLQEEKCQALRSQRLWTSSASEMIIKKNLWIQRSKLFSELLTGKKRRSKLTTQHICTKL